MDDQLEQEKYLCNLFAQLDETTRCEEPFEKADQIRCLTSQIYAEARETGDEMLASTLLRRHLDAYQDVVLDTDSVNNYGDEIAEIYPDVFDGPGLTESLLRDPLSYLGKARPCQGKYEDCVSWEPTEAELKRMVVRKPMVAEKRPLEGGGSPSGSSSGQLVPKKPAAKPLVEEISRRVFAPSASMFTPKVPSRESPKEVPAVSNIRQETVEPEQGGSSKFGFRTATDELQIQNIKKYGNTNAPGKTPLFVCGKKSLGGRRTLGSKFVCPTRNEEGGMTSPNRPQQHQPEPEEPLEEVDERLRHIEPKMIELIRSEIMHRNTPVMWDDIAGLDYAKQIIREAIVCPILRPDIFTGLRKPPRGILLFGPPGTGKTLIGKCIASQSKSTFFSISASSLTSKWIGEGEKMVRALFAVASVHQPAVVFIDEIDSLLCQRSETEHESSRRLKTEFLVQLDGAATADDERILIVGATNRPQELDEAARRRLVKRLYIPLPEHSARVQILERLLAGEKHSLTALELEEVGRLTDGFSGADMKVLCHEASMGPIRSIAFEMLEQVDKDEVRPVNAEDFKLALRRVRASVCQDDLTQYVRWDRLYGSGSSG